VQAPPKRENLFLNLACNLVVPTFALIQLSKDKWLGPLWGLIVALIPPVAYGIYDLITRKKTNFLSILGFTSVLLSGTFALLQLGGRWFAIKDATLPTLVGLTILGSLRSRTPLMREFFYNEQIIDVARVDAALTERSQHAAFEKLMRRASVWMALSFIASAPLGFALARAVLQSPAPSAEFNAELGRLHLLVWPVIVGPSVVVMMLVLWKLIGGLRELTGLTTEEIFHDEAAKKTAEVKS
jgi:hypothetical protein